MWGIKEYFEALDENREMLTNTDAKKVIDKARSFGHDLYVSPITDENGIKSLAMCVLTVVSDDKKTAHTVDVQAVKAAGLKV
jgi:hypothetical protein